MKKALLLLLLLLGRGLLLLLLLLLLGQDLLLLESDLLATQSHLRLLVHLCSFLLTALTRWIHHDMFTWCWMGFDIKILKTQVTGKTGLTVSLFCCLGLEDKNLRVGGGGQGGQVGGQGGEMYGGGCGGQGGRGQEPELVEA